MKKTEAITSVRSNAGFPEQLLEKFVQENLPSRTWIQRKTQGMGNFNELYNEIESCAAETPVAGNVEIFFGRGRKAASGYVSIPVNSRFFVFCTRGEWDHYKISWCCSLS
ncbi:MAG TPA: hypothetical protein PK951_05125 [Chitinophagaceae bacterium]|nr:hypothetical protein [Chitinophagaceae bacterium]